MRTETKSAVKNSIGRLIFVGLAVIMQVAWMIFGMMVLNSNSGWIAFGTRAISVVIVLAIYSESMNAAYKIPWIILILVSPVMGVVLYLLLGLNKMTLGKKKHFEAMDTRLYPMLSDGKETFEKLSGKDMAIANQCRYIASYAHYPVYQNTDVKFFSTAEEGIEAQKEELRKAKKFIFMEYHAIEDKESFAAVHEILIQKAKEGVEVRLFYDDIGSIGFINPEFIHKMEKDGIACRVFNPLLPFFSIFMNNRDHRKITVIDGKVGFTGGYNLANEYFNITHPYGHWKDTGIQLNGEAVNSLTAMFLEMWNVIKIKHADTDLEKYFQKGPYQAQQNGYVQPYADSPLDNERVGENVYMNIIKNAKEYVYFMTPYLIISDEMSRELELAAKRGVDVRIITPGIPDKKIVYQITRSYYGSLAKGGVRIFEYTPGFCHAKQCVCDGQVATVGTINLDYRSLYLHFENGVFMYDCDAVTDVKADFDATFPKCEEVTERYSSGRSRALRTGQYILRLISPLF